MKKRLLKKNFKMEFIEEIKIPKDRIAVLIGKKGKIKKEIQKELNVKIRVSSATGLVAIKGEDGLDVHIAKQIIQSIARGFNPKIAMKLISGEYVFDLVNVGEYAKTKKSLVRLRGRVIGKEGKARKYVEKLTNTHIVIYGKTVGIIGFPENVEIARVAIKSLLRGSKHSKVFGKIKRALERLNL